MRYCRTITRQRARNFYYGLKLSPEPQRTALFVIYAWMRTADDLVDMHTATLSSRHREAFPPIKKFVSTTNFATTTPPMPAARSCSGYVTGGFPESAFATGTSLSPGLASGFAIVDPFGAAMTSGAGVMQAANTAATANAPSTAAVRRGADDGVSVIASILRSRSDVDSVIVAAA